MAELLYLPDNEYQKSFKAEVEKTDEVQNYVCLDKTLFYKEGGGQPSDRGLLKWKSNEAQVTDVKKENGEIRHYIKGETPDSGTMVKGEIDWERRYKHMKMHTAQHVVSKVVLDVYNATTAGNQIHAEKSRIDFKPVDFDNEDVEEIEEKTNRRLEKALKVEKMEMDRKKVEQKVEEGRTNLDLIPDFVDPLRVVVIGENDLCPCGGTHVDNTEEIGNIDIVNRVSKGADVERLEFKLV